MKKIIYFFVLVFLSSCTSNTILEEPKNLIPKDTMSLLVQEMMIATSSKFMKNKNIQKKINYMSFVYDRFKIDSVRFQTSNYYYMSKIDLYQKIFEDAKKSLEKQKDFYDKIRTERDSLRTDSIKKMNSKKRELHKIDTLKKVKFDKGLNIIKDTLTNQK